MPDAIERKFAQIDIGEAYSFPVHLTAELVDAFAEFSGDRSPLHMDAAYAQQTKFGQRVAHGMIAGALFSRLVGMYLPGRYAVYLSQSLLFHNPIYLDSEVIVSGKIIQKSEVSRSVVMETHIQDKKDGNLYVTGQALVQLLQ